MSSESGRIPDMDRMTQQIARYLDQTLDEKVTLRPWSGADRLPLYLRDRFVFREGMLFDTPVQAAAAPGR